MKAFFLAHSEEPEEEPYEETVYVQEKGEEVSWPGTGIQRVTCFQRRVVEF